MKHKRHNRTLGREANHRRQLLQQLTSSLLEYGFLVTTEAKAKELRKHFEPLVTVAKRTPSLHQRRLLLRRLLHGEDLPRLLEISKIAQERPGGYTRLTRLPANRDDAATMVRVDIVK